MNLERKLAQLMEKIIACAHLVYESIPERGEGADISPEDVTVLIPCFMKADTVKAAVQSVLNNTSLPGKVLVLLMDSASRGKKAELEGLSPIVECAESRRLGICSSRNKLVSMCRTEWFTFLDADDFLYKEFFSRMCRGARDFNFSEFSVYTDSFTTARHPFLQGNLTGLFRKEAFLALGGLDAEYRNGIFEIAGGEDSDFMFTVLESAFSWRCIPAGYFLRRRASGTSFHAKNFYTKEKVIYIEKHRDFIRKSCSEDKTLGELVPEDVLEEICVNNQQQLVDLYFEMNDFPKVFSYNKRLQLSINNTCNRSCRYCTQAGTHYDVEWTEELEEKWLEKIRTYMELYTGKFGRDFVASFVGGEIGLWSRSFLGKIKELFDTEYPDITTEWITNGLLAENADLPLPENRVYYIHIVDWHDVRITDIPAHVIYNIVVCEEDLDYLDAFLERNIEWKSKINILPRQGNPTYPEGFTDDPAVMSRFVQILCSWEWSPYMHICYQQMLRHELFPDGEGRHTRCLEKARDGRLLYVVRIPDEETRFFVCCNQTSYFDAEWNFHEEPCHNPCGVLYFEGG